MTRVTNKVSTDEAAANAEKKLLRQHPLHTKNPSEVDAWVDTNVKSLPEVIEALKVVAKLAVLRP